MYLNRQVLGEWKYGYSSFYFDMTDFLCEGENEIVVQVRFLGPNSRWYSGAGIYRNVYLTEYGENHFVTDGVYLTTDEKKDGWQLTVEAELAWNRQPEGGTDTYCVEISVTDLSGTPVAEECCPLYGKETMFDYILKLPQVVPWSLQKPALYLCSLKLMGDDGKKLEDEVCQRIGFRRFSFDTEKGFFLNGVHTKLNGVCEHHDLGALGAAFHRMAMRRKMLILKEMGVNSIRCAHNMPAPELLDLADEMGILIVDEAFDMWERAKTPYDYARFIHNRVYQGDMVYRKAVRTQIGCKQKVRQPEEKWLVIPDHHEAIVSRELFKKANDSIRKGKIAVYDRSAVRRGIVFCGCCGNRLELRKTKSPYYLCKRRNLLDNAKCNELQIEKEQIERTVWTIWQEHCRLFATIPLSQFFEKQQEKLRKQENILMQRLERFPAEKINLYEQFRSGMVKQDVFLKEKEQLSRQEEVVRRQIEKVSEQIDMQEEREKNYRCVADLVKRYGTSETLTEEFMREMVEKVIVDEDKRIEIVWKYREEFEELL